MGNRAARSGCMRQLLSAAGFPLDLSDSAGKFFVRHYRTRFSGGMKEETVIILPVFSTKSITKVSFHLQNLTAYLRGQF